MDLLIFQVPILMVQASLDGILLGILFALIAYGMALQWGVMNIINIAQGDLVILGGYITYFMYLSGIHPALGVIVAPAIMYFVGVGLYKLLPIEEPFHTRLKQIEFQEESHPSMLGPLKSELEKLVSP